MQEIIASMSGSRLDSLSSHYRQRVLEDRLGEDDSGNSSTELRRVSMFKSAVCKSNLIFVFIAFDHAEQK